MSVLNILRKLILDNVILVPEKNYSCKLPEPDSDYAFEIRNLPEDALIIKCDSFPKTAGFFKSNYMECKKADYALISESKKVIMFFELKRSNYTTHKENVAQLKGAKCVIDYCGLVAASFLDEHEIFDGFTDRYYIVIVNSSSKRSFKKRIKPPDNRKPDDARKIYGNTMPFRGLCE